jgi:hypothetical protein
MFFQFELRSQLLVAFTSFFAADRAGRSRLVFASDSLLSSDMQDAVIFVDPQCPTDGRRISLLLSTSQDEDSEADVLAPEGFLVVLSHKAVPAFLPRRILNAAFSGIVRSYVRRWGAHWVSLKRVSIPCIPRFPPDFHL